MAERREGEAEALLNSLLLQETFATLESRAMEAAIAALPLDHEMRKHHLDTVRAIRSVRRQLEAHLKQPAKEDRPGSPV